MAVEFRCPECRAKLRLAEAPPVGEEIECPKCSHVFEAPEPDEPNRPVRKKRPSEDEDDPPARAKKSPVPPPPQEKPKAAAGDKPEGSKKRKLKKKKANTKVLIGACVAGGLAVLGMVGILVYLLSRQPPAVALMSYLPNDAQYAYGINFSQIQKYVKFYKQFEGAIADQGPDPYGSVAPITSALGVEFNDLVDYAIGAGGSSWGDSGDVLVLKTKAPIDRGKLIVLDPKPDSVDDVPVYKVDVNPDAKGGIFSQYFPAKVFAPTDRVIVIAPRNVPNTRIQQMLRQNSGDDSFVSKMGSLGKRVARGNVWWFSFDNRTVNVKEVKERNAVDSDDPFVLWGGSQPPDASRGKAQPTGLSLGNPRGIGLRANLRSKSVSFEVAVWYPGSEIAGQTIKAYDESELAKGDEGTPPQSVSNFLQNVFQDKILIAQIQSNLSFSGSGDLFLISTAGDVTKVQDRLQDWSGRARGIAPQ